MSFSMNFMGEFERQRTVFRDHPLVVRTMELKASGDLELHVGSVLAGSNGVVDLADDSVTSATFVGICLEPVTLNATENTMCAVVLHGDCVLDELEVASGANKQTVAAVLKTVGISAY